jgi:hypothetical protein
MRVRLRPPSLSELDDFHRRAPSYGVDGKEKVGSNERGLS